MLDFIIDSTNIVDGHTVGSLYGITFDFFYYILHLCKCDKFYKESVCVHQYTITPIVFQSWIRLALNDGVLESYMDSILEDTQTTR